jgi:2-polyprenyl-3-methyl-5-hydroxy-6-metoxy-1,4-benzoquinol methylase
VRIACKVTMLTHEQIFSTLDELAGKYPQSVVGIQKRDIPRIAFHISAAIAAAPRKKLRELTICDIGGGMGLFSVGCAALGFGKVILVDDFRDRSNQIAGDGVLELHRSKGVEIHCRDIIEKRMTGLPEQLDVVTSFDSMEHWHHSPKTLFREVFQRLAPGGGFLLGGPNCVNLRKRMTVPFGRGQWSSMNDWYEAETFRGHVREPSLADLRYIARDMGLVDVRVFGCNWLGCNSGNAPVRLVSRLVDRPLRWFPSLCSDIYVSGTKPADEKSSA